MKQFKHLILGILSVALIALTISACSNASSSENAENASEADAANPTQTALNEANPNNPSISTNANNPSATVEPEKPTGPTTSIEWAETTFDFGVIEDGEKVTHTYEFTNTGDEPLIITNAKGSCGCTVPQWPKEPIPAGEKGEIKVEFNSKGKGGKQTKRVTIDANVPGGKAYLTITGTVNKKDNPTAVQPKK